MSKPPYTHKGWFGLCPIYLADIESEAPILGPRHWIFEPLMLASEAMFALAFFVRTSIDPGYEPSWPIRITGDAPKVAE